MTRDANSDAMESALRRVDALLGSPRSICPTATSSSVHETHISWVLLAGERALKLRKPVDLGFVDFLSQDSRDHHAREEVRLNRRWSPELYLGVVPVFEDGSAVRVGDPGEPAEASVDTGVLMRRFGDEQRLDRMLARDALGTAQVADAARALHRFQSIATPAKGSDAFGTPTSVMQPIRDNFVIVRESGRLAPPDLRRLDALEAVVEAHGKALAGVLEARRTAGRVREGHGDLHLENLAWTGLGIRAFDALEFAPHLRWIDVCSDLAFLFMDLLAHGRTDLAWVLITAWHDASADVDALRLLRFYACYRAMVRLKVAVLRADLGSQEQFRLDCTRYLDLAESLGRARTGRIVLMSGPSGSGKSHAARRIGRSLGAVVLRSDIERKFVHGSRQDRYGAAARGDVYERLLRRANILVDAGVDVVLDATYLHRSERSAVLTPARSRGVRIAIVACDAPVRTLRARIAERHAIGRDPSEADAAVLEGQLADREPVLDEEADTVFTMGGDGEAQGLEDWIGTLVRAARTDRTADDCA